MKVMEPTQTEVVSAPDARPCGTRRLRVLMVVDGYYPSIGGTENQVRLLSRALTAQGHVVTTLAPRLDTTMAVRDTIDSIPVERLAYPRIRGLGALLLMLRFAWRLLRTRHHYDAIHIHMVKNLATIAGLLRPFLQASVMIKISGAWEFDGGILDRAQQHRLLTRLRNACIRGVDYVQCISIFTHERLREAGYPEAKLCMIPNAVEVERFDRPAQAVTAPRVPTVVFIGRIEPVKGLDVLIRAWHDVRARHTARLIIAGDGSALDGLKRLATELGLADSIAFLGEVSHVPELLRGADVYVQPSYQEGLPNSVLEAMAAGLPVVATQVSGNEDVVANGVNGWLVPPGDAQTLATALCDLLSDLPQAQAFGRRSRQIVEERFQISAVLKQLIQAYQGEL